MIGRNSARRRKRKDTMKMKRKVLTVVLCMFSFILLEGCESEKKSEEVPSKVVTEEQTVAAEDPAVETEEETVIETELETTAEETVSEPESYATPDEWINSLELTEIKLLIYNQNGENKIISDGESYKLQERDSMYLYYPQKATNVRLGNDEWGLMILHSRDNYTLLGTAIGEGTTAEYQIDLDIEGVTHTITVTLSR